MSDATFALVAIGAKILFVWVIALATILPNLVWAERRVAGMIQDRPGPNRVGPFGLFQIIADGTKFFMKESVTPLYVDKLLYNLAPWITLMPGLVTFAVIPFGATLPVTIGGVTRQVPLVIADVNIGILYIFAFTGLGIYGIVLAGWSANNKYSLMGGLRASAQIISYELAMGFAAAGVFLAAGTLRLSGVVEWQQQHVWGVFAQPLAFVLFLTAAIAENKRIPFDLPECESELISGYFTEYTSMKMGLFLLSEFIEIVVISALLVTLFLGGYTLPFLRPEGFVLPGGATWELSHLAVTVLQVLAFTAKVFVVGCFQIGIRWTLPRFRYDQLMALGWKFLLPFATVNLLVTAVIRWWTL